MTALAAPRRALCALVALASALAALAAINAAPAHAATQTFETEEMSLSSTSAYPVKDSTASMGRRVKFMTNGDAVATYPLWGATDIAVRVRADLCNGVPRLGIKVDGTSVGVQDVSSTSWTILHFPVSIPAGDHTITLSYLNDLWLSSACERNMYVDYMSFNSSAPQPAKSGANLFRNAKLWVDPTSDAAKTADSWRLTHPADATMMDKIAKNSFADWFSYGAAQGYDIYSWVGKRVAQIEASGSLPFFVAYYIPLRDCGTGLSAGGAATPEAYQQWVNDFARALVGHKAAIILEPDAIGQSVSCLTADQRTTRLALLKYAVDTFSANAGVQVYLDAGQSHWRPAGVVGPLLLQAGLAKARGFALNTSNFQWNGTEIPYGKMLSAYTGGKPFVIDTSRNGVGPAYNDEWCNPDGRALGVRPTAITADQSIVDAYLWVHRPGDRDGPCNGAPTGPFWPDYALGLAQRASW